MWVNVHDCLRESLGETGEGRRVEERENEEKKVSENKK